MKARQNILEQQMIHMVRSLVKQEAEELTFCEVGDLYN